MAVVLVVVLAATVRSESRSVVQRQRFQMGTMFNIIVYHEGVADAERAIDRAMAEIARLDAVMSNYAEESDLARLNRNGRHGFVPVEPSLYEVIEQAVAVSHISGGQFDVTIAPLLRVWKEAYAAGRSPSAEEIDAARRCVGYQHIEMQRPNRIRFRSQCLELDLGGIGKGFAVEKALGVLVAAGIRHAIVNAGGSTMAAIGAPPGLEGWPVHLGAGVSGHRTLLLRDSAISTSQQRLRYLPFGPGAFGDIIDPQRQGPTASETIVSVVVASATRADALSTTLLLLPVAEGEQLLARFAAASAVWMSPDGELQHSYGTSQLRLADTP